MPPIKFPPPYFPDFPRWIPWLLTKKLRILKVTLPDVFTNNPRYDDLDVPDTMNVHGIYDTAAYMLTFESRAEYRTYVQQEAGVSGSVFGFYAGVKEAYGSSASSASQTFLSVLDVDVDRYG